MSAGAWTDFWAECWSSGQIGFHQGEPESNLQEFFVPGPRRVFVPLCGKSLDMVWLASQGCEVVGVELSALACEAFFAENLPGAVVERQEGRGARGRFVVYRAAPFTLYCGDYFDLEGEDLGGVTAVYDRAALIALPPELRAKYVAHLKGLLKVSQLLLVTIEYPQEAMAGPPFSVSVDEVYRLYGDGYKIEHCADHDVSSYFAGHPKLGSSRVREHVFRMGSYLTA